MPDVTERLRSLSTLAVVLASYGPDALAPYVEDIEHAHEGLDAVLGHLPVESEGSIPSSPPSERTTTTHEQHQETPA